MAGCGEPGRVEKLRTSIAKTSMPILTVIVLTIQPTVEYALFAVFITYFTTALIIFWLTPHALVQPTTETILNIIKYSKWSVSTSILNDFYHRWDTILLGIMVGSAAVSYYDASLRVAFLATTFAVGVSKTANVKMSGLYELDKDIQSLARKTLEVSTFLIFPLLLISLFNGTYLLKTLFGQTYTNAKLYLILLILVQLFQAYRMQFESIFNSTNNPHSTTKTSLIAVIFNVITAPLLVLKFGGYGVLYSTLLAEVLRLILYEIQLKELFNHYIFPNGILVQYTSVIIIATTLHIIQQFNPSNTLFVPLSILLSTIGFYTIQYTFSTQTQEILSTYRS
jgi:O-antigen/teichoic acid export membrane protein